MQIALEARHLVKQYPDVLAVNDLSFQVRQGICFGLLGPNGAGKTTTVEIMEGVTPATSGEVWYFGEPAGKKFRQEAGIQFQNTALQDFLTVRETLDMFQTLYDRKADIPHIIEECSLGELLERDNRKLSGGQRQRLLLAVALVNKPRLVFLDEPTTGLDPQARRNFWDLVQRIRAERAAAANGLIAIDSGDVRERFGLGEADRARFEDLLTAARGALEKGDPATALAHLKRAERLDEEYAELYFHRGRAFLTRGRSDEARESFSRARDLDTLRFRADSRTNAVIAEVAAAEGVPLVDAEGFFLAGGASGEPLPGRKLFYEHVHLNFAGGYALAQAVLEEVEKLLPPKITGGRTSAGPPSLAAVADQLAFSLYDAEGMEREILGIVSRPPFTGQWGHRQDLIARRVRLRKMRQSFGEVAWQRSAALYEARLASRENDLQTRRRYAELLASQGESERAAKHWQKLLEAIPDILSWYDAQALALATAGRGSEAIETLERALDRFPEEEAKILVSLGAVYEKTGEGAQAAAAYRRSWQVDPSVAVALYNLATMKAHGGDLGSAIRLYRELLEHHPHFTRGHHNLGVALERQGDLKAAARSYRREIVSNPEDPAGYNSLGFVLAGQGDLEGAMAEFAHALKRDPGHAPALFNLADHFLSHGRAEEALVYYETGLALEPGNLQAQFNLASAYGAVGRQAEARTTLQQGLEVAQAAGLGEQAKAFSQAIRGKSLTRPEGD